MAVFEMPGFDVLSITRDAEAALAVPSHSAPEHVSSLTSTFTIERESLYDGNLLSILFPIPLYCKKELLNISELDIIKWK